MTEQEFTEELIRRERRGEGHWCSGTPEWDEAEGSWVCGYCENWVETPTEMLEAQRREQSPT